MPSSEAGIKYNDPLLKIEWPLVVSVTSIKDEQYPLLNEKFKGV
jgi:dTDP-4-dehydrorhamnose 3,5-epimerase